MKKIIIVLFCMMMVSNVFAQKKLGNREIKWLSLAIKGGYGGTAFFNSDITADENVTTNYLSPSYSYGGRFGITYGANFSINIEPLFSGFSQEYNINDGSAAYAKNLKFTSMDYLVSLRYVGGYGFYFEAGPQFSTIKTATVENSKEGTFMDESDPDFKSNFAEKTTSLAVGLGYAILNGDRLQINLGLRGTYTFGNLVEDPTYYILNDGVYRPAGGPFVAETNPLTLKLMLEVNYFFGFWGDASCGRGRLMFFQ